MFDFGYFINTFYDVLHSLPFFRIFTIFLSFSLFSVSLKLVRSFLSVNSFFSIPSWFFKSSNSDDDSDDDYDYYNDNDSGYDSSDVIYDPFKKRFF